MSAPKFDRNTLKAMFFKSEDNIVKVFFENIGHTYSAHICRNTKGRTEEKKAWRKELANKVIDKAEEDFIETYKPDIKELSKYHRLLMGIVAKKLISMAKKDKDGDEIFMGDVEKLWRMIKTEKNEPTTYTKTDLSGKIDLTDVIEKGDRELRERLRGELSIPKRTAKA